MERINIVGLEQERRIMEIAVTGNHGAMLIGRKNSGKRLMMREFLNIIGYPDSVLTHASNKYVGPDDSCLVFDPAYCHNGSVLANKRHGRVGWKDVAGNPKQESMIHVAKRVFLARYFLYEKPFDYDAIRKKSDGVTLKLIEEAYDRLSLNSGDVVDLMNVAYTIFILSREKKLGVGHVAEAIAYCPQKLDHEHEKRNDP